MSLSLHDIYNYYEVPDSSKSTYLSVPLRFQEGATKINICHYAIITYA